MPAFEIEVLSNPSFALNTDRPFWDFDDYSLYARYDIDLIKPALLFGDHVNLVTFRETMRYMTFNRGTTLGRMPMHRVMSFLRLVAQQDAREAELLGLNLKELPTAAEAEAILTNTDSRSERLQEFWDRYDDQIERFADSAYEVWHQRFDQLEAPELRDAVDSGILTVESWLTVPDKMLGFPIPDEVLIDVSVGEFLDRLAETSYQPMLDVGADWIVKNWPIESARRPASEAARWRGPTIVAANAIMRMPGLEQLSLKEVLDIRRDLAKYLPAFRSEMVRLGEDLVESDSGKNSDGLAAEIDRRWYRDIAPILEEIRRDVAAASYPRRLLNTMTAQKDALASAGGAVVLAAGSVAAGISTLVPAAFAAAYPLAKALNDAMSRRSNIRKNRLYLLYALEKDVQKRLG